MMVQESIQSSIQGTPMGKKVDSGQGSSSIKSGINKNLNEVEVDENDPLFKDDGSYDLVEMIKDESEDEEEQKNFEINSHVSRPIDLLSSHKYREEVKSKYY